MTMEGEYVGTMPDGREETKWNGCVGVRWRVACGVWCERGRGRGGLKYGVGVQPEESLASAAVWME